MLTMSLAVKLITFNVSPSCLTWKGHLDYALGRAGLEVAETARAALVQAWNQLRPWPEAEPVLAAVKARGYRIGALSNGDEAMLRAVLAGLATPFDDIFASDHAGYYKPMAPAFETHVEVLSAPTLRRGDDDVTRT